MATQWISVVEARPEHLPLYGTELLKALADTRNSGFSMTTMGEVLPRYENYVEIDKSARDAWGVPALHIQAKYSEKRIRDGEGLDERCRGVLP